MQRSSTFWQDDYTARTLCRLLCISALLLSALDIVLYFYEPAAHVALNVEDGLVENLTFFFDLLAGLYILVTLGARGGRFYHVVLAVGLILLAGEEISWGQRIFHIAEPPALYAINEQHELNLHNIQGIHEHVKSIGLFLILLFAVVIPVLHRLSRRLAGLIDLLRVPLFPWEGSAMMIYASVLMTIPRLLVHDNPMDEMGEMLVGLAFVVFALGSLSHGTGWRLLDQRRARMRRAIRADAKSAA